MKIIEKKEIIIKFNNNSTKEPMEAYEYLKNKIFINLYLIKDDIVPAEKNRNYKYKEKFCEIEKLCIC